MAENIQITVTNARLSYANIFRAKAMEGSTGEPKFSCVFLLDKKQNAKDIKTIQDAIAKLVKEGLKGKHPGAEKVCLKDGSVKADTDGYGPEVMFVSAGNVKRPVIVNRDRSPLAEEDGKPYSGCYVNGVFNLWVQDNKYGRRINASLTHVQFVKDGEQFGEKVKPAEAVLPDLSAEDDDAV
jgi:hypothetical protein